jgi:3-phenylpropionate/trans-cinnamate dioxygenase ferredoxin subunit
MESDEFEFFSVAKTEEIPNGKRVLITIREFPIVVFKLAGEFYAIADVCSHDDGPLGDGYLGEFEIVCPRHGARFDIRTGKVLTLPAIVDIPAYPVRIKDEEIQVGVPVGN